MEQLKSINEYSALMTVVVTVGLVVVTAIYVVLTKRILLEYKKANEINTEAIKKQFRLQTMPHVYAELKYSTPDVVVFYVYNVGKMPAFDLDIYILGVYSEEDLSISSFKEKYMRGSYKKIHLQADDEGLYSVSDRIVCSLLPTSKRLKAELSFPTQSVSIEVLVQYREVMGDNFSQLYWFHFSDREGRYVIGSIEPKTIEPCNRIEMKLPEKEDVEAKNVPLEMIGVGKMSNGFKDFLVRWKDSVSSGLTTAPFRGVEEKCEIHDI